MQNDITPPSNWGSTKKLKKKSSTGAKLSSQSVDRLKGRLGGIAVDKPIEIAPEPPPEPTESPQGQWSRKRKIIASAVMLILVIAGGFSSYLLFFQHKKTEPAQPLVVKAQPPPAPKTVASPLTGLQVDPASAARPVTAIMIENSLDARPQSGLQDAGVVFEAEAEGGVTRFMALYQDATPQYIGPVRSLRTYYLDMAAPFQASIAHVGGAPDALAEVRDGSYRDLDQFFNSGSYWRSASRAAPHNVYTSFAKLDALNQSKGYTSSKFTPWPRKTDKPLATPTAAHINITTSGYYYNSHYDYNPKSNTYMRSEAGAPHMDVVSPTDTAGVQLNPKVVIALVMGLSHGALDASGAYYSNYLDTGSGQAFVFQDGGEASGTWSKSSQSSMLSFSDPTGRPIALDAGQVWIVFINSTSAVSYTP